MFSIDLYPLETRLVGSTDAGIDSGSWPAAMRLRARGKRSSTKATATSHIPVLRTRRGGKALALLRSRARLWVTTKLRIRKRRSSRVGLELETGLRLRQTDYVISPDHWPNTEVS